MVPGVWAIVQATARAAVAGVPRPAGELLARHDDAGGGGGRHPGHPGLRAREGRSAERFGVLINDHAAINMAAHRHARADAAVARAQRPALPVRGAGGRRLPGAGRRRAAGGADPVPVPVERAVRGDPEPRQPVQPGADGDGGGGAGVRAARHAARLGGPAGPLAAIDDVVGRDRAARAVVRVRGGAAGADATSSWWWRRAGRWRWSGPTGSGKSTLASPGREAVPADDRADPGRRAGSTGGGRGVVSSPGRVRHPGELPVLGHGDGQHPDGAAGRDG